MEEDGVAFVDDDEDTEDISVAALFEEEMTMGRKNSGCGSTGDLTKEGTEHFII